MCLLLRLLITSFLLGTTIAGIVRLPRQAEDDNCGHPFHSFLCHKAPRARVSFPQPAGSAIDSVAIAPRPLPRTTPPSPRPNIYTPTPPQPSLTGENSLLDPTFIQPKISPKPPRPDPSLIGENSIGSPVQTRIKSTDPKPSVPQSKSACHGHGHTFHSFLCQPGTGRRKINTGKPAVRAENSILQPVQIKTTMIPAPVTTPEPGRDIQEASFLSPTFNKPPEKSVPKIQPTPRPTVPTTRFVPPVTPTKIPPSPPEPETPDATFDSPSFLRPQPVKPLQPAQQQRVEVTTQSEHYRGQDACNHAFHSYLCQPAKSRRRNYGRAPDQAAASFQQPLVVTTTTQRSLEIPEASQLDAVAIQPKVEQPQAPVYLPPLPVNRPPPPRVKTPQYLPPTTRAPVTRPPPLPVKTPEYLPPTTRAPPLTQSTTQIPARPTPNSSISSGYLPPKPNLEEAADNTNSRIQLISPEPDKCKHAFHSFLCQPATRQRKIQQRVQHQPAASFREGSLLLPEYRTTEAPKPSPTRRPDPPTTRRPPPPPPIPVTTTTTKYLPPELPNQVPDSSFLDPQILAPRRPAAATQQNAVLPVQSARAPVDTSDACNHPFHSFLCHKAPRARRPIKTN